MMSATNDYLMHTNLRRQRGLGMVAWLLVIALVVFFTKLSIAMVPAYYEYSSVKDVINGALSDPAQQSATPYKLKRTIAKRFSVNRIEVIKADAIKIKQTSQGVEVSFEYDVKQPLFYNVSIVMHFADTLTSDQVR